MNIYELAEKLKTVIQIQMRNPKEFLGDSLFFASMPGVWIKTETGQSTCFGNGCHPTEALEDFLRQISNTTIIRVYFLGECEEYKTDEITWDI